jgi:putative hydrolase of the HAD superfamily
MAPLRALMVDVDGVVITPRPGGWAATLERDLGLSSEILQAEFFRPHWDDVALGRADLHDRLAPVLARHAPHLTSHWLVAYWFEKDAQIDTGLLDELTELRRTGVELHLATIQEAERAAWLWNTLGFRHRFDALHYSGDIGAKKTDAAFYAAVEARTGLSGAEVALIDDTPDNVDAARAAGWRAVLWDGTLTLTQALALAT